MIVSAAPVSSPFSRVKNLYKLFSEESLACNPSVMTKVLVSIAKRTDWKPIKIAAIAYSSV